MFYANNGTQSNFRRKRTVVLYTVMKKDKKSSWQSTVLYKFSSALRSRRDGKENWVQTTFHVSGTFPVQEGAPVINKSSPVPGAHARTPSRKTTTPFMCDDPPPTFFYPKSPGVIPTERRVDLLFMEDCAKCHIAWRLGRRKGKRNQHHAPVISLALR